MPEIDIKKTAGFLLAGAVVGAGIALLYSRQSGAQASRDVRKFARKTVDRLDDLQSDIRNQVTEWVDDMAVAVQDGVDQGKKLGAEGHARVLQGFDNMKQSVEEGKARVEHMINKGIA
jgi:gas vesicle protein